MAEFQFPLYFSQWLDSVKIVQVFVLEILICKPSIDKVIQKFAIHHPNAQQFIVPQFHVGGVYQMMSVGH